MNSIRFGRKGQTTAFPLYLAIGFFGFLIVLGMLGGVQGVVSGVVNMSTTDATTKFALIFVPIVLVFSVFFWTIYYVRGGA